MYKDKRTMPVLVSDSLPLQSFHLLKHDGSMRISVIPTSVGAICPEKLRISDKLPDKDDQCMTE